MSSALSKGDFDEHRSLAFLVNKYTVLHTFPGFSQWNPAIGTAVLSMPPICTICEIPASILGLAATMVSGSWQQICL
jgi:hypothetical protein